MTQTFDDLYKKYPKTEQTDSSKKRRKKRILIAIVIVGIFALSCFSIVSLLNYLYYTTQMSNVLLFAQAIERNDISLCDKLQQLPLGYHWRSNGQYYDATKGFCSEALAEMNGNPDLCYVNFPGNVSHNDPQCVVIANAIKNRNSSPCGEYTGDWFQVGQFCYFKYAIVTGDASACANTTGIFGGDSTGYPCYEYLAVIGANSHICENIKSKYSGSLNDTQNCIETSSFNCLNDWNLACHYYAPAHYKDSSLCEKLTQKDSRAVCKELVQNGISVRTIVMLKTYSIGYDILPYNIFT